MVTYEFENVPFSVLVDFVDSKPIIPSAKVLEITQNRALEKDFLKKSNLPHVNFLIAQDLGQLQTLSDTLSFPVIVKSTMGGYDGKLQQYIESQDKLNQIISDLNSQSGNIFPAVIEEAMDLYMEVSCITAHNQSGQECTFPVLENQHVNHILDTTLVPARIDQMIQDKIVELAVSAARRLGIVGILCTEFFITKTARANKTGDQCGDYTIYINEFAPRPHNSGHVTINACSISQFDALARILLDIPLSRPKLLAPGYFCMANLLGDVWLSQNRSNTDDLNLVALKANKDVIDLVIYGKKEARPRRKMGHFVIYETDATRAFESAKTFRNELAKYIEPSFSKV